jgi:plastocyanin
MKTHLLTVGCAAVLLSMASVGVAGTVTGKVDAKPPKLREDTVVYVEAVTGKTFAPPEKHAEMDQANLSFVPHVLPVLVGTTVNFKNSDDVLHNVFTPDECADKFNLGSWAQGEVRSFTFKNAGCTATILCKVHPEMEAYVLVLQNPYFAVTTKDGSFTIPDVPKGDYTLQVWNERLKGAAQKVTVGEADTVSVNITLKH